MPEALVDVICDAFADDVASDAAASATADATVEADASVSGSGTSEKQAFNKVVHQVWDKFKKHCFVGKVQDCLRRRMNHVRGSSGNPYNVPNTFQAWLKTASVGDVKEFCGQVLKKFLNDYYHMSDTIIDRAIQTWKNSPLTLNKIRQHKVLNRSQKWIYLTNTKHSDHAIYKIRRRNISANKLACQMDLVFMSGSVKEVGKIYSWHMVPVVVFMTMTMIPLTYLTKHGYLAGAWNFFWYASLTNKRYRKSPGMHEAATPSIPFFNKKGFSKTEIAGMTKSRLDKIMKEPIRTKKHMLKPTARKRFFGSTSHLKK